MKNVKVYEKKNCIFKTLSDFEKDLVEAFNTDVTVITDWDGLKVNFANDSRFEGWKIEDYNKVVADYYGVTEVTSIHIDDNDDVGVWIVYKDLNDSQNEKLFQKMFEYIAALPVGYEILENVIGMTNNEIDYYSGNFDKRNFEED